jgi:TPP-dependent 2-oxoacid decarboxylase
MGSLSSKVFTKFNRKIPAVYLSDGYARISNVTAVTPTDGAAITSAKVVSAGSDIGTIEVAFFTDRFPLNSVILDISYTVQGPMWTM